MSGADQDEKRALVERILAFIRSRGLKVEPETVEHKTFMPGMEIRHGVIWYDAQLRFVPGDLLHEAGHLAVANPETRDAAQFETHGGEELSAIAWSYAAAREMGLPLDILFHEQGHREDAGSWTRAFEDGNYFGLPLLHLWGMTIEPRQARPCDPPPYPHMLSWVRDAPDPPLPDDWVEPAAISLPDRETLTELIAAFIRQIGFEVRAEPLTGPTGLPGMTIRHGAILYDPATDYAPGDLLHEAGHLAVCPAELRGTPELEASGADEASATAWSYAANRHLHLPTEVVFHAPSFKGEGPSLAENFDAGRYYGLALLQLYGMTIEPGRATADGPPPFPHMLRWIR
jgi:hypothetical protein